MQELFCLHVISVGLSGVVCGDGMDACSCEHILQVDADNGACTSYVDI